MQLNGWDIPIVNQVTYLGDTFVRRMTTKPHIERNVAKALRTYVIPISHSEVGV
jgi:hypothetical protein